MAVSAPDIFKGHLRQGGVWKRIPGGEPWPWVMVLPSARKHGVPWETAIRVMDDPDRRKTPGQGRAPGSEIRNLKIWGQVEGRPYEIGIEIGIDAEWGGVAKLFHAMPTPRSR